MREVKPMHYNVPQIKTMLVRAWESYLVWSRGTGKSSGALAPFLTANARDMPRSQGGILGETFMQLLHRTLPPVIKNWTREGYVRDVHYVIGREPSAKWKRMYKWNEPYVKPLDSKYSIYWFNGSVVQLISQDRSGSSNGLSLQYLGADESKLLDKEQMDDETLPTMRGERNHFGHLPCYSSKMFLTDMPTDPKAKWILEKESEMNKTQIDLILKLQLHINLLKKAMIDASTSKRSELYYKVLNFEKKLTKLRFGSVYYAEANVLDNIDVLGQGYLKDMKKNLSPLKFATSIMNERSKRVGNGFYELLNPDKHGQSWAVYSFLDNLEYDFEKIENADCRKDGGMVKSMPLDVAFDYGSNMNCCVVGQTVSDEYRIFKEFYVLHPQLIADVVDKFCSYYKPYNNKTVNYYFDHTAVANSGVTSFTYKSQVVATFNKHGWKVNEIYCNQAPTHDRKYEFWGAVLQEEDRRLPKFRYHKYNCEHLETSMLGAGLKQTRKGFEKDKSPERDESQNQEDATHLSDAVDTLVFFKHHNVVSEDTPFIPSSQG